LESLKTGTPSRTGSHVRVVTWPAGDSPFLHRTGQRCPTDQRIENFLNDHFEDLTWRHPFGCPVSRCSARHGIARELSIPEGTDSYGNPYLPPSACATDLAQPTQRSPNHSGNVPHHRRGLPIPVIRSCAAAGFRRTLPSRCNTRTWINGRTLHGESTRLYARLAHSSCARLSVGGSRNLFPKTMEIHFFAPGGLISNLDFVESIFGNAGDPYLRKTMLVSMSSTGRDIPDVSSLPPPNTAYQAATWSARLERRDQAATAGRDVLA